MTRKMADAMNVELEYQLKRSMGDFLAPASVVPPPVTAAPLTPGGAPPNPAPGFAPPLPPVGAPPASEGPADAPPETPQMSPPPGFLQVPPGQ
jgi:hypothetical protein